ncbi:MAG: thiamine pyrophosphate-binding protein, partial [Alphaproteobacteria bacterium]
DAIVMPLLAEADLVLACGYDPIEMRAGWQDPWEPGKCIEIQAAPDRQDMHGAAIAWSCGIAAGLAALGEGVEPHPVWPGDEPERVREALHSAFAAGADWGPAAAIAVMDRMKPEGLVTTVDSGAHRILLSQMWHCVAPHSLLQSTGLCTMGCALPLATGRALAEPGRRCLAVMGDGCLDMILGELATLRDLALPVTVAVLNDASLALIELKQRREGLQTAGVEFGRTDYAGIARALGLAAWSVSDAEALAEAFAAAMAAPGPGLIEIALPRRGYDGLF